MLGIGFVLFLALRARLASLSVAVLPCYLLVGIVASLVEAFFRDAPRSTPSSGCSSPFGLRLVYRLARSPRLLFFVLSLVQVQDGCVSWPPVPFILRLPGLLGDCGFADV